MTKRLSGNTILVTRPCGQAEALCGLITSQGASVLHFPTIAIEAAITEPEMHQRALSADWLIFTSSNAVDFALPALDGKMANWIMPAIAAVGAATAQRLRDAGLPVACVPISEFSSEGLLQEPAMHDVAGKRCVIVRGIGGREKLADTLRQRGADVEYWEVYRRYRPTFDNLALMNALQGQELTATTVTSSEGLHNLLSMVDETSATLLRKVPLLVVSDRIRETAEALGFETIAVSRQATDAAILETLTTLLSGEHSG